MQLGIHNPAFHFQAAVVTGLDIAIAGIDVDVTVKVFGGPSRSGRFDGAKSGWLPACARQNRLVPLRLGLMAAIRPSLL